jgi:tetratricopeptide (TPR) repeat protein
MHKKKKVYPASSYQSEFTGTGLQEKTIRRKVIPLFIVYFLLSGVSILQGQLYHSEIMNIRKYFKNFEYQTVIDSSLSLLRRSASADTMDLLELYRLLGVSYYSVTKMDSALAVFVRLLRLSPAYELNRHENSPKIIAFYNEIRRSYHQDPMVIKEVRTDTLLVPKGLSAMVIATSVLMPGTGHIQMGEKTRGWILTGLAITSLGAAVYFTAETGRREEAYLSAVDKNDISAKYNSYNDAYRLRNAAWIVFGSVWLYTQADLLFFTDVSAERRVHLSVSLPAGHLHPAALSVQVNF